MIQSITVAIKESMILKGFLGIFMLSFGIWGVGDFVSPTINPNIAVKYEDYELPLTEYQRRYDLERQRWQQITGRIPTREQAIERGIPQQVIQALLADGAVRQAAADFELSANTAVLQTFMQRLEPFRGEDGNFQAGRVLEFMAGTGMNEGLFEDILYTEFFRNAVLGSTALGGAVPNAVVDRIYDHRGESRVAETLLINTSAIEISAEPSEDQLQATYEANLDRFTAPEYRSFDAIVISIADIAANDPVTDELVQDYYDRNIQFYLTDETRAVRQILFDSEGAALEAAGLITPDASLDTIAETVESFVIDLGQIGPDELPGSVGDAVFELQTGLIAGPIQSDFGWHLFQVSEIFEPEATPLEEVSDEIRETLAAERVQDELYEAIIFVEDEIAGGSDFADIAAALSTPLISVGAMDRLGQDRNEIDVPDLPDRNEFIQSVFSTPAGVESPTFETEEAAYVIRVNEVIAPAPKPMDLVMDQVRERWVDEQRQQAAEGEVARLTSALGPSVDVASLADGELITYARVGPITRTGTPTDPSHLVDGDRLSSQLLTDMFDTPAQDLFVATARGGEVVGRITEVIEADRSEEEIIKQNLQQDFANGARDDMLIQMENALVSRYSGTVNTDAIRTATGL